LKLLSLAIDLIENYLKTLLSQLLEFLIILKVEFHQGRLGSVPALSRVRILLVFVEEVSHFALNRFLAAVRELGDEVLHDLLLAFKGTMHKFD
jgi:hypothetical protein